MHYAVILADILIISSVGFIAIKLNKRKRRKRELINKNKPDMEIFRGSPDRLERSKKERLNGGVESHFSDISKKELIVRTDFSKHINRNDGNGLMRERLDSSKDNTGNLTDLAEQTARSFEHGGLNMSNNSTSYFNL